MPKVTPTTYIIEILVNHRYKYTYKLIYGKTVLEGSVKVRRVHNFLIWKVTKTPRWEPRSP